MALSKNMSKLPEPVQKLLPEFSQCQENSQPQQPSRNIIVHEFSMGDVDDPDLYAAQPLWEFERSEKGQWVIEHALEEPIWQRQIDHFSFGYRYKVAARLTEQDITYFMLRWC